MTDVPDSSDASLAINTRDADDALPQPDAEEGEDNSLSKGWRRFFDGWLILPVDPHDEVDEEKREAAAEGALEAHFIEASEAMHSRYEDRSESVRGVQTVSAFTFGGVVALFVAICAGILAAAPFYKWMPAGLLPSLLLSAYSVICFLAGVDSTHDQIHPTRVADEYIEVLDEVKKGKGDQKVYSERSNRSIHQRYRLWMNRVWVHRGIIGMQLAVLAIFAEMLTFAVLIAVLA